MPLLSILLILDLLLQGDQTVNEVLRRRWLQYLAVILAAFVVFANRRRWLKAIDRRFFRERNYAFAVLQDVAEQVRRAGSLDRVAPVVVAKIQSAMYPEFAALMVRDPEARAYRTIAAAPSAAGPPDLREDSRLVAHARIVEEPLDTSKDSGEPFLRKLSSSDREYITNAGIDAVIRIVSSDEELHALLVLGPKRSEEPYAEEDFGVLVTIAENLSLLAARSVPPRDQSPTLEECPECGACFDAGTRTCSTHSRPLVATALPRTLLSRYRLDRRLAAGGMGTVYKAFDLALDHDVAAKVIGDAVIARDGALERFFSEAKILASLRDHSNVVTVYDFGRIGDHQAYLIMELLIGRTLRQLFESDGRNQPAAGPGHPRGRGIGDDRRAPAPPVASQSQAREHLPRRQRPRLGRKGSRLRDRQATVPGHDCQWATRDRRQNSLRNARACRLSSAAASHPRRHGTSGASRSSRSRC